jgi:hypothetical protein
LSNFILSSRDLIERGLSAVSNLFLAIFCLFLDPKLQKGPLSLTRYWQASARVDICVVPYYHVEDELIRRRKK